MVFIRIQHNIDIGDGRDDEDENGWPFATPPPDVPNQNRDWLDLISDANSYLSLHLLITYIFTGLALFFIFRNYQKFIRARQLFTLELVHSIAPRTVMVTRLPPHLRGERALAEYFENGVYGMCEPAARTDRNRRPSLGQSEARARA